MALTLGDNFSYQGAKPLDARLKYATLAEMKAVGDATMYDGCMAYCSETEKTYQWKSTNPVDASTGRWREFSSGGGGGSEVPQLSTMPAASAEYYDQYVLYIGTNTDRFRRFCYYHCVHDSQSGYRWDAVDNAVDGAFRYDRDTLQLVYSYDSDFRCLDKLSVKTSATPTSGGTTPFTNGGAYTELNKKQNVMQATTMPTASADYVGKVYQFIGTTTASYTHGHFYECKLVSSAYTWVEVDMGGGTPMPAEDMEEAMSPLPGVTARYHEYSENEQIVGKWIDGRPIYEKTVDCGVLPSNTTTRIAHNISNYSQIIEFHGTVKSDSGDGCLLMPQIRPYDKSDGSDDIRVAFNSTYVVITTYSNTFASAYSQNPVYVTIKYLKTT